MTKIIVVFIEHSENSFTILNSNSISNFNFRQLSWQLQLHCTHRSQESIAQELICNNLSHILDHLKALVISF